MTNSIDRHDLLREIHELWPAPIHKETQLDGTAILVGGDPAEVIVCLSGSKVSIAVYSVRWEGLGNHDLNICLVNEGSTCGNRPYTTECENRLQLAELCERFANGLWLPDHVLPHEAEAMVLDQFRLAIAAEVKLLDVSCTQAHL